MKAKALIQIVAWMLLSLLLGVWASVLASRQQAKSIDAHVQQALQDASREIEGDLTARLRVYEFRLRGWRGVIHMLGREHVTFDLFTRYSRARNLNEEFPGARGFGFIRKVQASEESEFVRQARADGQPGFQVHQFTPHAGERYVVQYIDPPERNLEAIGLDIASEPRRQAAAQSAMLTGKATLTAPITFINESREESRSFLFLLPVYRTVEVPPPASREQDTLGWSYAPLAMSEVMTYLDLPSDNLHLALQDVTDQQNPTLIFETSHPNSDNDLIQTYSFEREVYGRTWRFDVSAHASFVEALDPVQPGRVFLIGLLAALLMTGMLGTLLLSRWRQQEVVAGQARLATIVENSSDAIIGEALDGRIITWNRAAEQMFGYTEAEILGRPLAPLLVPHERLAEDEALLERVARGERGPTLETQRLHKDGRLIDVTITCSLIREADDSILGAAKLMHDISDRIRAEHYLREFNANLENQVSQRTAELSRVAGLLQAVLDASSEVSIIALDLRGEIIVFNRGAERLLGYSAEEMIGRLNPMNFHLREEVEARSAELSLEYGRPIEGIEVFRCKADEGRAETRQWTYVRKDGEHVPVSLVVTAIRTEGGIPIGHLGIAQDITERLRSSAELHAAKASAERANAAKSLFLANMSHEIRTPMNAVIGVSHLLQSTHLDEQQQKLLGKLQIAGRSLLGIINDILDIAKIEAGEMQLENSPFRPRRLLSDLTELFAPQAEAKGLRFAINIRDLPDQLSGDALRLNQILMNLIGNALKFTSEGGVEVDVDGVCEEQNQCLLRLSVKDTGCGIAPDVVERLFSPFTQADTSTTRRFGGTGLGLSVVRGLAEKMGGNVGVHSTLGTGSDFWVRLPFQIVADDSATDHTALEVVLQGHEQDERQRLTDMCRAMGWRVTSHGEAADLLRQLQERLERQAEMPDVLIMVASDSPWITRQAASLLGAERMPLCLVLGSRLKTDAADDPPPSFEVFGSMPLHNSDLFNMVNAGLQHIRGHSDKLHHGTHLDVTGVRWLDGVRLLLVDDSDINLEVASLLLQQQGAQVHTCMNGRHALDRLREHPDFFDAVLMDLHMPEMDGFEATRRLRNDLGLLRLPVLALTAGALAEERRQAQAAGMDDFLSKPLEPSVLIRAIRRLVERARGAALAVRATAATASGQQAWPSIAGIDTAAVAQRMAHDLGLFQSSLQRLFNEFGRFREAANLQRAWREDPDQLIAWVHKLRGVAGNVGAHWLNQRAGEVETMLRSAADSQALPALLEALTKAFSDLEQQVSFVAWPSLPAESSEPATDDKTALPVLITHLRQHDMAALEQFAQAARAIRAISPGLAEQVWQAIDALDFEQALNLLNLAGLVSEE